VAIAGGIAGEAAWWISPELTGLRTLCKAVTAAGIIAYALCFQQIRTPRWNWGLLSILCACVGDVVIVHIFVLGAVLFALAHIGFIICFSRSVSLHKAAWAAWGAVSAAAVILVLILGAGRGIYAYGAAVYAPILLLMTFYAAKQQGVVRIAAFLLFASDLLLALYQWSHIHPVLHVIYMSLFYAALLLLARYLNTISIDESSTK